MCRMEQGSGAEVRGRSSNAERWALSCIYIFTNVFFGCLYHSLTPVQPKYYFDEPVDPPMASYIILCEVAVLALLWGALWTQWIPLKRLAQVLFIVLSVGCLALLIRPSMLSQWFTTTNLEGLSFRVAGVLTISASIWLVTFLQRDVSYLKCIKGELHERQAVP